MKCRKTGTFYKMESPIAEFPRGSLLIRVSSVRIRGSIECSGLRLRPLPRSAQQAVVELEVRAHHRLVAKAEFGLGSDLFAIQIQGLRHQFRQPIDHT